MNKQTKKAVKKVNTFVKTARSDAEGYVDLASSKAVDAIDAAVDALKVLKKKIK